MSWGGCSPTRGVASQLVDVAEVMVDNATKLSHHEFRITVRRWEMLADLDGAHRTAEAGP